LLAPPPLRPLPAELTLEERPASSGRRVDGVLSVVAALFASLFLLFLVAPLIGLVGSGGASGLRQLSTDAELRSSLLLTIGTATLASLLAIIGATPVAYALARGRFRGRAIVAAIIDLPLLIPHPVAGIALLLVLGQI
jgi:molybdate/tungstate transport system permease protein